MGAPQFAWQSSCFLTLADLALFRGLFLLAEVAALIATTLKQQPLSGEVCFLGMLQACQTQVSMGCLELKSFGSPISLLARECFE